MWTVQSRHQNPKANPTKIPTGWIGKSPYLFGAFVFIA
jgi:hypothetical protein